MKKVEFIIGSTNKAKVKAVKEVLSFHFPHTTISSESVASGVKEQPFSEEETRLGAINRSLQASKLTAGAIGIGLEGGVRMLDEQLYLCNWGAMTLPDHTTFTAGGAQIPLPKGIAAELLDGKELGPVIDTYYGSIDLRHNEGAIGMLTAGAVNRDELFVHVLHLLAGQLKCFLKRA